jgi:hypothetical protein
MSQFTFRNVVSYRGVSSIIVFKLTVEQLHQHEEILEKIIFDLYKPIFSQDEDELDIEEFKIRIIDCDIKKTLVK